MVTVIIISRFRGSLWLWRGEALGDAGGEIGSIAEINHAVARSEASELLNIDDMPIARKYRRQRLFNQNLKSQLIGVGSSV